jgi:hypothetical protein
MPNSKMSCECKRARLGTHARNDCRDLNAWPLGGSGVSRRLPVVEKLQLSVVCDNAVVKCLDGLDHEMWDELLEGSARSKMGEMENARTQDANALSAFSRLP